jgi:prolyl-tRNA synthetase
MADKVCDELKKDGWRVLLDAREEFTPGWKFSEWEMRGVPIRIEIGTKDVDNDQAVVVRRDKREKKSVPLQKLCSEIHRLCTDVQENMLKNARDFQVANTRDVGDYEDFKSTMESKRGFIRAMWCGDQECEDKIKEETQATIRIIPLEGNDKDTKKGMCLSCQKESEILAYFAKAY